MKISFIIIAFNEESNIATTLRGVLSQEGLTDVEVIVVDDGSTDRTVESTRAAASGDPRIKILPLGRNMGRGAARAAGVAAATGQFIAFVDADIRLPRTWLAICLQGIPGLDACGGLAVPDGDVTWLYRVFALQPKIVPHDVGITGNNGLFDRSVFDIVAFDPQRRHGEDVALSSDMAAKGLRTAVIDGLIVEHCETKSWPESVRWLYTSGLGATEQLWRNRRTRTPDHAYFGFLVVILLAFLVTVDRPAQWGFSLAAVIGYAALAATAHAASRFRLAATPLRVLPALAANTMFMLAYFTGRSVGLMKLALLLARGRPVTSDMR